jgi:hypothetical protein
MNNQPEISVTIPPLMWKQFRQAMLDARQDREEVIGFFFAQRQQLSRKKVRYIPQAWVVPTADCYEHQSTSGLVLKQQFHQYLLDSYLGDRLPVSSYPRLGYMEFERSHFSVSKKVRNLDVIHIHTHFGDASPSLLKIF